MNRVWPSAGADPAPSGEGAIQTPRAVLELRIPKFLTVDAELSQLWNEMWWKDWDVAQKDCLHVCMGMGPFLQHNQVSCHAPQTYHDSVCFQLLPSIHEKVCVIFRFFSSQNTFLHLSSRKSPHLWACCPFPFLWILQGKKQNKTKKNKTASWLSSEHTIKLPQPDPATGMLIPALLWIFLLNKLRRQSSKLGFKGSEPYVAAQRTKWWNFSR